MVSMRRLPSHLHASAFISTGVKSLGRNWALHLHGWLELAAALPRLPRSVPPASRPPTDDIKVQRSSERIGSERIGSERDGALRRWRRERGR
jgi:hypothetical protein